MTKIQEFLDELLRDSSIDVRLNSKRRLRWLRNFHNTNRLRRALNGITARICALVILKHLYVNPYANLFTNRTDNMHLG